MIKSRERDYPIAEIGFDIFCFDGNGGDKIYVNIKRMTYI